MPRRSPRWFAAFALLAFPTLAPSQALVDPIPAPIPPSGIAVRLETVADGLVSPVFATFAPGNGDRLFVLDQPGQIWAVDVSRRGDDDQGRPRQPPALFADLSARLVRLGVFGGFDERGLLGLAFHPDFRENGLLYTFTSEPPVGPADFPLPAGVAADCHTTITEWRVRDPEEEVPQIEPGSERVLLRIAKPQFNHNGGTVAFGPDGMLYVSVGDGGAADDEGPGHAAGGNAQSLAPGNLLGKILRIDPAGRNAANGRYGIPAGNPFRGAGIDEVWAYGLRNPYRMSFDEEGRLLVADVGQNHLEEIDVVERGGNYGWPIKEGTFRFDGNGAGPGFVTADSPGQPAGLADPVAQYDHQTGTPGRNEGIAVVGGFVYRGREIRELRDRYVFGDYSRAFFRPDGRLFVLAGSRGAPSSRVQELAVEGSPALGWAVLGFGQDRRGEIYLLANKTGVVLGQTGAVMRLARPRREGRR